MRKDLGEKIEIPEGMGFEIAGDEIVLKKDGKEIRRRFCDFRIKKEGNMIELDCRGATKNEKKLMKTTKAHIINMIKGLKKKYTYKLQVCAVHFPMTLNYDKLKNELLVKNYLGEVKPRKAKILKDVDCKIDKEIITIESFDKEKAGQTAANIEKAVKINNRDRRVFQDGIYITEKPE